MLSRLIVLGAIVTYLLIVGCTLIPVSATANDPLDPPAVSTRSGEPLVGLPYVGAGMQIQRIDWLDRYKTSIDEIAAVGCDTVSLVVDARQENGTSNRIYLDMRMTPTPDGLIGLIKHAKSKGLRVLLMPIVLLDHPRGSEWRGTIKPEKWDDWWESYRAMIHHFAWVAQAGGVDVLSVGSELVSTESNGKEWARVIREVRNTFKGQLTYSSNWDHYSGIPFWDDLDLIGMNSYWKLGSDRHVTIEQIVDRWRDIQDEVLGFVRTKNKPLLFTEVGWCSMANMAHEPWDYTKHAEPIDLELQRKLYEAFFQAWYGNELLGGFMIWEWTPGDGGERDRGYTPENKPAERVLREHLAKPRWSVK